MNINNNNNFYDKSFLVLFTFYFLSDPGNYKPVCLLLFTSKLMKALLKDEIIDHLQKLILSRTVNVVRGVPVVLYNGHKMTVVG